MQKRLALLVTFLVFALALTPTLCLCDDDMACRDSSHIHFHHLFAATNTIAPFEQNHRWTGLSLSLYIYFKIPQSIPSASATRAPPA